MTQVPAASGLELRIGCCVERLPRDAVGLPFDYLEVALDLIEHPAGVPPGGRPAAEVVMGMYPRGSALVGGSLHSARARAERVLMIAAEAGAGDLTFGSGAARSIPPELSRDAGYRLLGGLFAEIQAASRRSGVRVHIETISQRQSNVFNTVGEIAEFIDGNSLDGIGIAYDLKQAALQSPEAIADARAHAARISHVHVPADGLDDEVDDLIALLASVNYTGRLSIEPAELAVTGAATERAWHVRLAAGSPRPAAEEER